MNRIEIKELTVPYHNKYEYVLNLVFTCKNSQQKCYIILIRSHLEISLNHNIKLKFTNINPNGKAITTFDAILLKFSYLKNSTIRNILNGVRTDMIKSNSINNSYRLKELESYCIIDSLPEKVYDDITELTASICNTPVSLITLVGKTKHEMQKTVDTSLDVICTFDREGHFLTVNKACEQIWRYSPEDLILKNFIDYVCPEDKEVTLNTTKSILAGNNTRNFENRYVHKDGSLIPMFWSASWDETDKVMYCIARDIKEKKKAEQQLRQSERRFKTLVQEGSDLIAILDPEANYLYASPTSTKILQIDPEEFVGTNAFDYIHPDDQESVYRQFKDVLEKSQVSIEPFRFKNKQNEWRWIETVATNQINKPTLQGIVVNSRDITERILYLKAIEKQNAKLKEIAWTHSQIVRAPVARLMGLVSLIREEQLEWEEKERILNYIIRSADEIDSVIKQIVEQTANEIAIEEIK